MRKVQVLGGSKNVSPILAIEESSIDKSAPEEFLKSGGVVDGIILLVLLSKKCSLWNKIVAEYNSK